MRRVIKAEWTNKDSLDLQPTCNQLATDLINRQDAIEAVKRCLKDDDDWFQEAAASMIKMLPSADIQEVESATIHNEGITFSYRKTGEWIDKQTKGVRYTCSNCTGRFDYQWKFCPNCGARMVREEGQL